MLHLFLSVNGLLGEESLHLFLSVNGLLQHEASHFVKRLSASLVSRWE